MRHWLNLNFCLDLSHISVWATIASGFVRLNFILSPLKDVHVLTANCLLVRNIYLAISVETKSCNFDNKATVAMSVSFVPGHNQHYLC